MSLSFEKKQAVVSEVSNNFSRAHAAILSDYRGLTVAQISELRHEARINGVEVRIVKNSLARRSVSGSPFECLSEHFVGPLLVTWSQDAVLAAKVVSKFAKSNDSFQIKIGAIDGDLIDESTIMKLALLPSRDQLLAKFASTLRAPLDTIARTLNEVPSQFVRAIVAVCDQQEAA